MSRAGKLFTVGGGRLFLPNTGGPFYTVINLDPFSGGVLVCLTRARTARDPLSALRSLFDFVQSKVGCGGRATTQRLP